MLPEEMVTKWYTVCDECGAYYEHSPTNYVAPSEFDYCPNCGERLGDNSNREVEHDISWHPPVP